MSHEPLATRPRIEAVGENHVPIWGMTNAERIRRLASGSKLDTDGDLLLANVNYVFDPNWLAFLMDAPDTVVTRDGVPVLARVSDAGTAEGLRRAMLADAAVPSGSAVNVRAAEDEDGVLNSSLRKRERPFAERLVPSNVRVIERASYFGAYKGVTDLLTKYLWPEWAFALTRLAARVGITPNQVTAAGTAFCIAATLLFWNGWLWTGMLAGLAFMVLDTVDGKLARCTITSSAIGNVWDHGIDLVHPPFWWWAWAVGCAAYSHPLSTSAFRWTLGAIIFGYVAQRVIEGAFMRRNGGMHIHVWRRFDSQFRLVTARRNPNMVILFVSMLVNRPDWGIMAVACWTIISLVVHLARLVQSAMVKARGGSVVSWLA
jgi:phosphatidylglycerophosphate synthase